MTLFPDCFCLHRCLDSLSHSVDLCGHAQNVCDRYKSRFSALSFGVQCPSAGALVVYIPLTGISKMHRSIYDFYLMLTFSICQLSSLYKILATNTGHPTSGILQSLGSTITAVQNSISGSKWCDVNCWPTFAAVLLKFEVPSSVVASFKYSPSNKWSSVLVCKFE